MWFLVHKWKMMTDTFFRFFKILIVQVVRGVKVQKMAQNDKKLCLTLNVRNCTYMIVVFGTMCKMMRSLAIFFFFFSKFWFLFLWERVEVKGQKMTHNYQFQSVKLYISRTVDYNIKIFSTWVKNNVISWCFSLFFIF